MLSKVFACYRQKCRLSRIEFLFGFVLISFLSLVTFWVYTSFVSIEKYQTSYLVGKSLIELLVYVLLMPIIAGRFRDIGWSPYFVLLLIPIWLFTARNLIIYMKLKNIPSFNSPVIFYVEIISAVVLLITLVCMLLFKADSNKTLNKDATAVAPIS